MKKKKKKDRGARYTILPIAIAALTDSPGLKFQRRSGRSSMGSILFRNRIRCREKSLSKRCIIRVENRYLPGNCDPTHRDDRMTGIRHSSEPGRRLLVNIFLLFFPLFPLVSLSLSTFFPPIFFFLFFFLFVPSFVTPVRLGSRECGATISRTRHYACQKQQYRIRMCPFPGGRGGDIAIRRK